MKTDTHGLKMTGLKKTAGQTSNYGYYSGQYDEIFYNTATGEVWSKYQYSLGHNSWTEYHDSNIIKIANCTQRLTMQQLADLIANSVKESLLGY